MARIEHATVEDAIDMLWDARENLEALEEELKKIRGEIRIASESLYYHYYANSSKKAKQIGQWRKISENGLPREREEVFLYFKDNIVIGYLYQSITQPSVLLWNIHNWLYDLEEVEYWMPKNVISKPEEQEGRK